MGQKGNTPQTTTTTTKCPLLLFLYLILALLSHCGLGLAHIIVRNVTFNPSFLGDLRANDESGNVTFEITYYTPNKRQLESDWNASVRMTIEDPSIARVNYQADGIKYDLTALTASDGSDDDSDGKDREHGGLGTIRGQFTVNGIFIGRTHAQFVIDLIPKNWAGSGDPSVQQSISYPPGTNSLDTLDDTHDRRENNHGGFTILVLRSHRSKILNAIFISTLGCLIIIANVMMGCQLNLSVVREVLTKPIAPAIGFACQFLLMPLIAFALTRFLMHPFGDYALGLGLFTAGCAPGGGASNFWTVLLDGNADLSITMTFISTVAAFGMMPFWMGLVGRTYLTSIPGAEDQSIRIPYKNILISLSILVGPLVIGIAIKHWLPKIAEGIRKVMRPFLILIILFIISFGTYANLYMFRLMTWQVLLGGLLLPFIGFWLGCFAALIARQPAANVAAIAIETGVQNSGIAIMLLKLSFEQPDADIASVVPVVVSIFTPGPLLLGFSIHYIMKFIKEQEENGEARTLQSDVEKKEDGKDKLLSDYYKTDSHSDAA